MAVQSAAAPGRRAVPRNPLAAFWASTIGKKVVMAVSGLIMAGFLITHAAANLLAYAGAEKINGYSHFLNEVAVEITWVVRLVLLASVVLHVIAAVQLTRVSGAARPVGYAERDPQVSTMASRTIRWGGLLLFLFIIYHLLHFTFGTVHPDFRKGDPYTNLVVGFQNYGVAAFYVVMMVVLGLHLYHGTWSALRTLGVAKPSGNPLKRRFATIFAVALWLAFTLVPVGVVAGVLR
jgi:succinate dehydrogenase / fumarate reductase cytochrome b subunit